MACIEAVLEEAETEAGPGAEFAAGVNAYEDGGVPKLVVCEGRAFRFIRWDGDGRPRYLRTPVQKVVRKGEVGTSG